MYFLCDPSFWFCLLWSYLKVFWTSLMILLVYPWVSDSLGNSFSDFPFSILLTWYSKNDDFARSFDLLFILTMEFSLLDLIYLIYCLILLIIWFCSCSWLSLSSKHILNCYDICLSNLYVIHLNWLTIERWKSFKLSNKGRMDPFNIEHSWDVCYLFFSSYFISWTRTSWSC